MGFLAMLVTAIIIFTPADSNLATDFRSQVSEVVSIEQNQNTGLTDFEVLGKEFSLDVQPLDYSKLNN